MTTVVDHVLATELRFGDELQAANDTESWSTEDYNVAMGHANNGDGGKDVATFYYRSEINLITAPLTSTLLSRDNLFNS